MNGTDELRREVAALRSRIAALGAASLRIGSSLDHDTVLSEVVDSARELTGARYGSVVTIDETGAPEHFITRGITEEEQQAVIAWPDGPKLFERLRDLERPLRLDDFPAFVAGIGMTWDLLEIKTFLATPMRHQGLHVGNFYLIDKACGQAFTDEDEEMLLLFATQAASAVANARTFRAERQARADLETLIETSPFGVVVFDIATGQPVSVNGEARRIVSSLHAPDSSAEELLDAITLQRADGSEYALAEYPLAEGLARRERVRAEEITLSLPDGNSVSMLINATPIPAQSGAAGSMVVVMQDLAPLEELDRQRSEFLGMVSHELRTPVAAIKGSTAAVLGDVRNFTQAETRAFFQVIDDQANQLIGLIADLLDAGRIDAGSLTVSPESTEVAALVEVARTTFLSGGGRHPVTIDLPPNLPRVLADRERIAQVLGNLLANAARQAPESSPIRIAAERDGVHVAVSVTDKGRGIAPERLPRLFSKHEGAGGGREGETGGTGLGLAICKGLVEAHGGRIRAESGGGRPGRPLRIHAAYFRRAGRTLDSRHAARA